MDYRCFIRVNDPTLLNKGLQKIELEASDGNVYSLSQIADIFSDIEQIMRITQEPIGDIFDTVSSDNEIGFCFIHDHKKSFNFFKALTDYIQETLFASIGNNFAIVADITNYDDNSFGNHIFYSFGTSDEIRSLVVEGPEGLEMHEENEVSELLRILKKYNITETEKQIADKYYVKLENLMDYGFGFFDEEFEEDEE